MKITGAILKERREQLGISVGEVALSTKISPKVIGAMESGDSANLPAQTFLRGFLKSYSLFLKLDPETILKSYSEEMGLIKNPIQSSTVPTVQVSAPAIEPKITSKPAAKDNEASKWPRVAAAAAIVILIVIIVGVRGLIDKYQKERVVDSTVKEVEKKVAQSVAATPAATKPEPVPMAEPVKAAVIKEAEEPAKEPAKEVAKEVVKEPVREPVKEPVKDPVKAPTAATAPIPNAHPTVMKEIIIEALDKVDVKFEIKGEIKKLSLGPTQVHTIRTAEAVVMNFSDGGAVNLIVNGRDKGVPGELGKPKQTTIP